MRKQLLVSLWALLVVPMSVMAHTNQKIDKEKVIKKEFEVHADALLEIDNSYGNLNVMTWDENRIVIEVHIKAKGNDAESVQQKLDEITVQFSATKEVVSAETIFTSENSNWFSKIFLNNSVSFQVNYLVKMPKTNHVSLENDYGNIMLDDLAGRADISCDYGKITTKNLLADHNKIEFDYSDNCYFEYIKSGTIEADYSGFTLAKTKNINISADYTDAKVEVAEKVVFDTDYGSLIVGKVNSLEGEADYQDIRVENLYQTMGIDLAYGDLYVNRIAASSKDIRIDAAYSDIDLNMASDYAFDFAVYLKYADLETPSDFQFSVRSEDGSSHEYRGHRLKSNSGNSVRINSRYGDVVFH